MIVHGIRVGYGDIARRWLWRVLVGALVLGVIVLVRCAVVP